VVGRVMGAEKTRLGFPFIRHGQGSPPLLLLSGLSNPPVDPAEVDRAVCSLSLGRAGSDGGRRRLSVPWRQRVSGPWPGRDSRLFELRRPEFLSSESSIL